MSACSWRRTKFWCSYSLLANTGRVLTRVNGVCPLTHRADCTPCCLTFISKQSWFATYLMVIFPRKSQVKESQSLATTAHQTTDTTLLKRTSLVLMATCFCELKSHFQVLQLRCTCHSWDLGHSVPAWEKNGTPISMAGRSGTTVQNHWKVSVHPVLQLSWVLGRRERIQEWTALWC